MGGDLSSILLASDVNTEHHALIHSDSGLTP